MTPDLPLICPACRRPLPGDLVCAGCGARYPRVEGVPMLLPPDLPEDMRLSIAAWDRQWAAYEGRVLEEREEEYRRDYLQDTVRQLLSWVDPARHRRYLEIGCGPGFLGVELARRGFQVAGLDCCGEALKLAQRVYRQAGQEAAFVGGDLARIPLADGSVDFLYGGGVIEHFRDTRPALRELRRVLSPGGVSFNTVPYLSIGSLTYRQLWGNIPDVPGLRQAYEIFHHKLLGGRHCRYGYELAFSAGRIARLHREAGFSEVSVRRFEVFLPFNFLPAPFKPLARRLSLWRPFWPMIAVAARA